MAGDDYGVWILFNFHMYSVIIIIVHLLSFMWSIRCRFVNSVESTMNAFMKIS